MDKYFDVIIHNDSFYIVESYSKPKTHDSALETLKKIEFIVKNKLTYDSTHEDIYSSQSQYELFDILKTKSSQIHTGYHDKQSKLNWVFRKIFSKEKAISMVHTRIDNYVQPPQVLPLPNELIQEVAKYLEALDFHALAPLNRAGKVHATIAMLRRARGFGYEGHSPSEAIKYIEDLFMEVGALVRPRIIPKQYLSYEGKYLVPERILQNLKEMSTEDLFTILSNEKLYLPEFQKIKKIFQLNGNWKVAKTDNDTIKNKGSAALILSAKNGDIAISKLLLQHGADPNIPDKNGSSPLHFAAQAGYADIVELLLKNGAKVNERSGGHNTALAFACGYGAKSLHHPNAKVVALLLEHGADPNIPDKNGNTPLKIAQTYDFLEAISLLLDHNAHL